MNTLMIKDLATTEELDSKAMAAVRGGMYKGLVVYPYPKVGFDASKHHFSFDATQVIGQTQDISNANGNNVAFADKIRSTVNPTQTANNYISL